MYLLSYSGNFNSSPPRPSLSSVRLWPRSSCLTPRQHCVEVALEGKQVSLRQLQLKYPSSKSKSNSAIILRLGLGLGGTWAESVDGQLVQLHWKSTLSRPSPMSTKSLESFAIQLAQWGVVSYHFPHYEVWRKWPFGCDFPVLNFLQFNHKNHFRYFYEGPSYLKGSWSLIVSFK